MKKAEFAEALLQNVKCLRITKDKKGYIIESEKDKIHLPDTTNFEWRIKNPVKIKHMYFGSEAGKLSDLSFNVTFDKVVTLRISSGVRCYLYIDEIN